MRASDGRRVVLLGAAAVVALAVCVSGAVQPVEAFAGAPSRMTTAREPLVGLQGQGATVSLVRVDPLSLSPIAPEVYLGEYHDAWSLSPDGSQLALGVSSGVSRLSPSRDLRGRIGIYIVDLKTMKLVREIETGIVAVALGWLSPRRLVAGLQQGGTVLVDPGTGAIVRRWPTFSFPHASARTPHGLVMLFPECSLWTCAVAAKDAPRVAFVNGDGRLRSATLEPRIRLGEYDRAALVVDPTRGHAYVFAAGAPVADIDLRTMRVSYHPLQFLFARPGQLGGRSTSVVGQRRGALWLGSGRIVVFGRDLVRAHGAGTAWMPAGATLVNTATWRSQTLDETASGAAFANGRLIAYGPGSGTRGVGLRAYTPAGRRVFTLFDHKPVRDVQVSGGLAYARTPGVTSVADLRSGKIIRQIAPPVVFADVVSERN